MSKKSLFIVIEGLDGSGKSTVSRKLASYIQFSFPKSVKLTFEPHDPSCAGLFIRGVLKKKIKIFSHKTLALAFAANRLDHCDREINQWLDSGEDKIIICDRYYLSSLVYQSTDSLTMNDILDLNNLARKPDIIFFLNVSNKVCFERMKKRNEPKELFEKNLTATREKYYNAIEFLRKSRNENIIEIDGSGSVENVVDAMLRKIYKLSPKWRDSQLKLPSLYELISPKVFTLNGHLTSSLKEIKEIALKNIKETRDKVISADIDELKDKITSTNIESEIYRIFENLDLDQKGSLFLDYINDLGYQLGDKLPWTHLDVYELEFQMPGNISQRGTALLLNEIQKQDILLSIASDAKLNGMTDFMFIYSPGHSELVDKYYERGVLVNNEKKDSLFPSAVQVSDKVIINHLVQTICKNPSLDSILH